VVLQGQGLSVGFTAQQVQQLIQAERAGLVEQYTSQLEELAKQLGATQASVRAMLQIAGHDNVPVERWSDTLIAIATQYSGMRQALTRRTSGDKKIAELRGQALAALDRGAFDAAAGLLAKVRARERVASEQALRRTEQARSEWIAAVQEEAGTCLLMGRAALGQRDVAGALASFGDGLRTLASADPALRWSYAFNVADALYDFGDRAGRNDALAASIDFWRSALGDVSRERSTLDWAWTQNRLGLALLTLGDRLLDDTLLKEAVAAFDAALMEWTRERVPLEWARAQNHRGAALAVLGERANDDTLLKEAVAAFQAALTEWTRERVPLEWATAQDGLGHALGALGDRTGDTALLKQAIAAFQAALMEMTRERVPRDWAAAQDHLGSILLAMGEHASDDALLKEAVAAYEAALMEWTRERWPLAWATAMGKQGVALRMLAERTRDARMAQRALSQIELALATQRDGGDEPSAYYAGQLSEARALVTRLSER
jgi:tetratricopeptide (TPR) repeat protein